MKLLKRVGLNSLSILLARVTSLALSVVFVGMVARFLGVEVFGQYTLLASMVYIGNMFTTFGTDGILVRELASQGRLTSMVSTAVWMQVCLAVLWCTMVVLIALFMGVTPGFLAALTLYNLSLLPLAFYSVCTSMIRAFERMGLYLSLNLLIALLQILGIMLIIDSSGGLVALSGLLLLIQVISAVVALLACRINIQGFSLKASFEFAAVIELMRASWKVALISPLGLLLQRLNVFMLTAFAVGSQVGWFSAAVRLVDGLKLGHFSVLNALMPQLSRPATHERNKLSSISLVLLCLWSVVLASCMMVFASPVIMIVFGPEFTSSIKVLQIVSWVLVPYTFCSYLSVSMIMQGREAVVLHAHVISLAGTVILYMIFIRAHGWMGAAWATLASETLLAVLLLLGGYRMRISPLKPNAAQLF